MFLKDASRVKTHVATGEVTALKHELRNDPVELGAGIAKALLAGAKGTEVLSGLGDNVVVKVEVDTTGCCYEVSYGSDTVRPAKVSTQWQKVGQQWSLTFVAGKDWFLALDIEEDFDSHVGWRCRERSD